MNTDSGPEHAFYLPDFCTSRATLAIVLIVELTAFVLTLARQSLAVDFWTDLVRTSMFLLWIGLAGAALLCALRAPLARSTVAMGSAAVLALITAVVATVSVCAYLLGPTQAEELEVARTYQRMEQLRLGGRLQVEWKTDPLPANALVPHLMIQPLLENAIYHGIEPRAEGGTVTITGEVGGGLVTIVVRNPLDPSPGEREGNRLALANIRERLSLVYGERALMKSGRFDAEYIVTLRFPLIEKPAGSAAAHSA